MVLIFCQLESLAFDKNSNLENDIEKTTIVAGRCGKFKLQIPPENLIAPGFASITINSYNEAPNLSGTLNGATIRFVHGGGIAQLPLAEAGKIEISLSLTCDYGSEILKLGKIDVETSDGGSLPYLSKETMSSVNNSITKLRIRGKELKEANVTVVPSNPVPISTLTYLDKKINVNYKTTDCIPKGSFINVITPSGTATSAIKVNGTCDNQLF